MIFDNYEIKEGDQVYDVVFGSGTVTHVLDNEDRFTVSFGPRRYTYNSKGVGNFPMKTIYWQNPVQGFLPMKNDTKWEHFCKLRNAIAKEIWGMPEGVA